MSKLGDITAKDEDEELTAPLWMVTFSDLVTLLLTFFVLIVSMSTLEVQKFQEALSYFQGSTSILRQNAVVTAPQIPQRNEQSREQAKRYEEVLKYIEEANLQDKVHINFTQHGLHVMITDSVMFRSGEAKLIESSRTVLSLISRIVGRETKSVVVEGHTDDRPITTEMFPSNWELSAARAASVIRFLVSQLNGLPPERYKGVAYGEHSPIDTNDTPEGRARNRRVEILFSWEEWENNGYIPKLTPSLN